MVEIPLKAEGLAADSLKFPGGWGRQDQWASAGPPVT